MTLNLYAVTIDCSDAAGLAAFWSGVLDRSVDEGATEEFASIGLHDPADSRPHWMFVKVPEGKETKNRLHPDLVTPDLDGDVSRLVARGAVRGGQFEESGARWVTLADPEGNEFDVVAESA